MIQDGCNGPEIIQVLDFDAIGGGPIIGRTLGERNLGGCLKRRLQDETAGEEINAVGNSKCGLDFYTWFEVISLYYPTCQLFPVRNADEAALLEDIIESSYGGVSGVLVGNYKDPLEALKCKVDDERCLEGWMTAEGNVEVDPTLWATGQPDGVNSPPDGLAYTATIGGGNLYDNSPVGLYQYAAVKCCLDAEVTGSSFLFNRF